MVVGDQGRVRGVKVEEEGGEGVEEFEGGGLEDSLIFVE